ncbi:CLUMA_CG001016, isoform A [Clunio marinus]|uniref:CLUMA_CG001016, isoform A n=1 Tax=Clunio marinus TaxID=568069 RepID=A0A1J1HII3_9DIPT|nr:CLUMA_CG001016, isoform A [Clunio marinus]
MNRLKKVSLRVKIKVVKRFPQTWSLTMNNQHATFNSSVWPINRINQHKTARRTNQTKHQQEFNLRPGLINNLMLFPSTINSCLVNPFYVVNLNCPNLNSVLIELTNLVKLPNNRQRNHHAKVNEPLLTLTPFLCFFLSPLHAGLNRTNVDYSRYLPKAFYVV